MKPKQSTENGMRWGPVLIAFAVALLVGVSLLPMLTHREKTKSVEQPVVVEAQATNTTVSEVTKTNLQAGAKQVEFTLQVALGRPPRRTTNEAQIQKQQ